MIRSYFILTVVILMSLANSGMAQNTDQWLINTESLFDFSVSPPRIVKLDLASQPNSDPDGNYQPRANFALVKSAVNGSLDYFGWENQDFKTNDTANAQLKFIDASSVGKPIIKRPRNLSAFRSLAREEVNIASRTFSNGYTYIDGHFRRGKSQEWIGGLAQINTVSQSVQINIIDSTNSDLHSSNILYGSDTTFIHAQCIDNHKNIDSPVTFTLRQYDHSGNLLFEKTHLIDSSIHFPAHIIPSNKSSSFAIVARRHFGNDSFGLDVWFYDIDKDLTPVNTKQLALTRSQLTQYPFLHGASFTSNDSMLYVSYTTNNAYRLRTNKLARVASYGQSDVQSIELPDTVYMLHMSTGPNGKLYFGYAHPEQPDARFGCLHNPETIKTKELSYTLDIASAYHRSPSIRYASMDYVGYQPMFSSGQDFLHFKLTQKNCKHDYIATHNYSDEAFKSFRWELFDTDTNLIQSIDDRAPQFKMSETGVYLVRLQGTDANGRKAWRWSEFNYYHPPKVSFELPQDTACRFTKLEITPTVIYDVLSNESFTWNIHHNGNSVASYSSRYLSHELTETGYYRIEFVFNNGFCADTFEYSPGVFVIDAPKSGFTLSSDSSCTSLDVTVKDASSGFISSVKYIWSDGEQFNVRDTHSRSFSTPGRYKVVQYLKGATECESKDSSYLWVRKGVTEDTIPELIVASLKDNRHIDLSWKPIKGIKNYHISRLTDGHAFTVHGYDKVGFTDSFAASIKQSYAYQIEAIDSCNSISGSSNLGQTIYVSTINEQNKAIILNWTVYADWQDGVSEYIVETSDDQRTWNTIEGLNDITYTDSRIPLLDDDSIYYRIRAIEQNGNKAISYSNIAIVNIATSLFIPNAFSPNQDGKNDVFRVGHYGIESFTCRIYAENGQLVAYSEDPERIWTGVGIDGTLYPVGIYTYVIQALDTKGQAIDVDGHVTIVR